MQSFCKIQLIHASSFSDHYCKLAARYPLSEISHNEPIHNSNGQLTLVAAPIGNLGDMTPRAIETLKTVDTIACEDTRVTGKLLSKLGIEKTSPLLSYRRKREAYGDRTCGRIELGERIALISDAGMPAISDPGFRLMRECRRRTHVTSAPGLTAATSALALSGLPTDAFLYVGFLPPKSARKRFFESKKEFEYTIIVYESCHRIVKFLNELIEILGRIAASVSAELTKLHEAVHTGSASKVRERVVKAAKKASLWLYRKHGFEL